MRKCAVNLLGGVLAACVLSGSPLHAQQLSEGVTFLKAVRERDGAAVQQVLQRPGTTLVNTRDLTTGQTALHIVTERRDLTWLRVLTRAGANPNIADRRGVTPLQIATGLGFVEGAAALLQAGAQVDATNRTGETPLITAVHQNDVDMVRLLLSHGAKPDRSDNSGRTALDYARLAGSRSTLVQEFDRARREQAAASAGRYGPGS
ncbi:ankyrin repeat domain-containing protein [Erythrobacteraceae bacterium CFH 75059]|uniref:ankyrin repeat domain-containing protein n=1 Tax=Qipengyuania thermophila TaxID=2509361 RepID=UPI0010207A6A|nr:ankyrin repeat domain-containing protein [Qipengyuania thermophila]TCD04080.1 ankyrin repeat domain-containing protein [Erythrobacteraceae bacterium CFH 75059]